MEDRPGAQTARERRRGFTPGEQLSVLVPVLVVWIFGCTVLAIVASKGDVGDYLLDPAWLRGGRWYFGAVSQLGAISWTVAAASGAVTAWTAHVGNRPRTARFLLVGALATAVLLLDDVFEFHVLVHGGNPVAKLVSSLLVLAPSVFWLVRFPREVLRTRWQVLLCALVALGTSFLVDATLHPKENSRLLLAEDGPKFLGILAWATYFVVTARDITRSVVTSPAVGTPPTDGVSDAADPR